VFGVVVRGSTEDVDNGVLPAAVALDRVVHLRHHQLDRPVGVGKADPLGVDNLGDVAAAVARDDRNRLRVRSGVVGVAVVTPVVGEPCLFHTDSSTLPSKNFGITVAPAGQHADIPRAVSGAVTRFVAGAARIDPDARHILWYSVPQITMVDRQNSERTESPAAPTRLADVSGLAAIESYEVDDGIVFYDPQNPLAWVEAARTVPLTERC